MCSPEFLALRAEFRVRRAAQLALPLAKQRAAFDATGLQHRIPEGMSADCVVIAEQPRLTGLLLTPAEVGPSAQLFLHGGGYCFGSSASHREIAARIAQRSRARTLVLDYRLAPEHPFPLAVEDAVTGYRWLLEHTGTPPSDIAIIGDSAGGGLTIAGLVTAKDGLPMPAAAVVMSPWVDLARTERDTENAAHDPIMSATLLNERARAYAGQVDLANPLLSPINADLTGLPPLLIQVGTDEALYEDSVRLATVARRAGVDVTLTQWPGMTHGFQRLAGVPEAVHATDAIADFLLAHQPAPLCRRMTENRPKDPTC